MNDKIKKLAERAFEESSKELAVTDPACYYSDKGPDIDIVFEKFAELIVKECVDIGDNYQEILGNEPECFNCRKVAYGIVDKIKEHFGVEE